VNPLLHGYSVEAFVGPCQATSMGGQALELSTMYSNIGNSGDFRDTASGKTRQVQHKACLVFVTGVASDRGTSGEQ